MPHINVSNHCLKNLQSRKTHSKCNIFFYQQQEFDDVTSFVVNAGKKTSQDRQRETYRQRETEREIIPMEC